MKPPWKIYWCTTEDHDEDWFVIARSARDARRYHEDAEGYSRGDAEAELVCRLPGNEYPDDSEGSWPRPEDLAACGIEVEVTPEGRIARYKGRTFAEGMLEGEIAKKRGYTEPK